jgi:uncharacterized protein
MALTVAIRVLPGAPRTAVGGSRGEALIVRVTARPVAGQATAAALRAVAAAFGVRAADVTLVRGTTSRDKVVRIEGDELLLAAGLARLREG